MAKNEFKPGWIAQIFYSICAYFMYMTWKSGFIILGIIIIIPVLIIAYYIGKTDVEDAKGYADRIAKWALDNALKALDRDETLRVMLYLRPFELTNRMRFNNLSSRMLMTPESLYEAREKDLETIIAEQISDSTPLVALGEPGEHIGAGRLLSTEENWKQIIQIMARAFGRILVIPSDRPGTKWELQWLKNEQYLDKCYFLMPPQPEYDKINMNEYWTETANNLIDIGILLPPYDPKGQIFTLTLAGQFNKGYQFNLFSDNSIEKVINNLAAESSKVSNVSEAYTPRPKQNKTRTVSSNYIMFGGLLLVIILHQICGKR
ncbi:MAG: hypothetical protein MUF15_04290 [Acidobacteria bacterium]|jgi:hypothetical protein|nr:hypothetical protein [Acidobacteriota bacterium]